MHTPISQLKVIPTNTESLAISSKTGTSIINPILAQARQKAKEIGLDYAGGINPIEAWRLFSAGEVVLIDVRTIEEREFVGHVPGSLHVAWMTGAAMVKNPRFLRQLETRVNKNTVMIFLCRSGIRSAAAASAATKAGFLNAYNIFEGFEGDLDNQQQRGASGGWRHRGLPWVQD